MNKILNRLCLDVEKMAKQVGAEFDGERLQEVLETFPDGFLNHAVELRTTSKKSPGLACRYVDLDTPNQDPYSKALEAGLLTRGDHPVYDLLPQVTEAYDFMGWGVDADSARGLSKLWPFLRWNTPIDTLADIPAMAPAAMKVAPILKDHGYGNFSIIAADFHHQTTNIYNIVTPEMSDLANTRALCKALGLHIDDELLEYMSNGVASNFTFDWDTDVVQRFCIYVPAMQPSDVPSLPNPISDVVANSPCMTEDRRFIIGPTMTPNGTYVKIEIDWNGAILPCLQRCTQVTMEA